jgi:predicted AAA+ superfamily ATPase
MREQELLLYRCEDEESLLQRMVQLMEAYKILGSADKQGAEKAGEQVLSLRKTFYQCLYQLLEMAGAYGFRGNLWHCYLTNHLVNSENSYSISCEKAGEPDGTVNLAALHDMEIFREFFAYDLAAAAGELEVWEVALVTDYERGDTLSGGKYYSSSICDKICWLSAQLAGADSAGEAKSLLTDFYQKYGVGKLGLHKAFRIRIGEQGAGRLELEAIPNIAAVSLDDLVGYQIQKPKLLDNTLAFLEGRPANNCLLYGDAGTGKSSCIKALANTFYGKGLRVVEIYKHQFQCLPELISMLKNRRYKFMIYMDDLSFEDFEIEYKYLKAVIEGGLEKKPDNILIYATSNRRHLIRENYGDKLQQSSSEGQYGRYEQTDIREDMHTGDTVQEKLSLVARFGVTIYFGVPERKEFHEIVETLARRDGLNISREDLLAGSRKWELSHGGPSGRCARQYIDNLLGEK